MKPLKIIKYKGNQDVRMCKEEAFIGFITKLYSSFKDNIYQFEFRVHKQNQLISDFGSDNYRDRIVDCYWILDTGYWILDT